MKNKFVTSLLLGLTVCSLSAPVFAAPADTTPTTGTEATTDDAVTTPEVDAEKDKDANKDTTENEAPVINVKKVTIEQGDKLPAFKDMGITATDKEDKDLTAKISVKEGSLESIDTSVLGNYTFEVSVTDSAGKTTTAKVPVEVVAKKAVKPTLEVKNEKVSITEGEEFSLELVGATAKDAKGNDITKDITVKYNEITKDSKFGLYKIVIEIEDSEGNTAEKEITVDVLPKLADVEGQMAELQPGMVELTPGMVELQPGMADMSPGMVEVQEGDKVMKDIVEGDKVMKELEDGVKVTKEDTSVKDEETKDDEEKKEGEVKNEENKDKVEITKEDTSKKDNNGTPVNNNAKATTYTDNGKGNPPKTGDPFSVGMLMSSLGLSGLAGIFAKKKR